jgi:hypothetical protein
MGDLAPQLPLGDTVNAAVSLTENEWRDVKSLEFLAEAVRPAAPLQLLTDAGAGPGCADPQVVRRAGDPHGAGQPLRQLPAGDPVLALQQLAAGPGVVLDLSPAELAQIEQLALDLPTVAELRRGLVSFMRGTPLPYAAAKRRHREAALRQLQLRDENGRVPRLAAGTRLSPYESGTLLDGLVRRYRLRTFVHAYRHVDDAGFALTVALLFGPTAAAQLADTVQSTVNETLTLTR